MRTPLSPRKGEQADDGLAGADTASLACRENVADRAGGTRTSPLAAPGPAMVSGLNGASLPGTPVCYSTSHQPAVSTSRRSTRSDQVCSRKLDISRWPLLPKVLHFLTSQFAVSMMVACVSCRPRSARSLVRPNERIEGLYHEDGTADSDE